MTGVIYYSSMHAWEVILVGQRQKKQVQIKKKFVPLDGMLRSWRELGAVNERHED